MKPILVICLAVAIVVAAIVLTRSSDTGLSISLADDSLSVSVAEVDDGILIENTSPIACIAVVKSVGGQQQFELDVGESVTVTEITPPIEVWAVAG